jgi:hypothetical protein
VSIANRLVAYTSILRAASNSIPFGDEVNKVKGITIVLEWPVMCRFSDVAPGKVQGGRMM